MSLLRGTVLSILLILQVAFLYPFQAKAIQFSQVAAIEFPSDSHPQMAYAALQGAISRGTFDTRAEEIVRASEVYTTTVFQVRQMARRRVVTYVSEGDNFIGEWDQVSEAGSGTMMLLDTPYLSEYLFRLSNVVLRSPDDLGNFLSGLIPDLDRKFSLGGMGVSFTTRENQIRSFSARPKIPMSPTRGLYDFTMIGIISTDGQVFVSVTMGKMFTLGHYPVPPFVPERFPSLSQLAAEWPFDKVWNEIGRSHASYPTEERDEVLVTELARRGMTAVQFVALLTEVQEHAGLMTRAQVVTSAFRAAGKDSLVAQYLPPALARYLEIGPTASDAARSLMVSAARSCDIGRETEALKLLKNEAFQGAAFPYLSRCGLSARAIAALNAAAVSPEFEMEKRQILQRAAARR